MNLPTDFLQIMEKQFGAEEAAKLSEAIDTVPPTSIRINPYKSLHLENEGIMSMPYEKIMWCEYGRLLKERPSFTFDPLFHGGAYYVQEASSMYLNRILKEYIDRPVIALDLCAAPGGKSTLALTALPQNSLLVANEVMRQRCQILAENLTKWGNPNIIVTNNYAEDFKPLGPVFDVIICDAPCSGEGMFRKDEGAINDWSLNNVDTCWKRQREILENIWPCLKPGGIIIYSTCTYNHFEDEDTVDFIEKELGAERLPLTDEPDWNIVNGHFFPHKIQGEGFFICPLRKKTDNEDSDYTQTTKKEKKGKNSRGLDILKPNSPEYKELSLWIEGHSELTFYRDRDDFYAFPEEYMTILTQAKNTLKVVHSGIKMACAKGKKLQPEHSLAMSIRLNRTHFNSVELTLDDAIAYLRTEAITIDAPKGYVLLQYKGLPIGFGNNIGNRVNNLYPSEWKIRKNY